MLSVAASCHIHIAVCNAYKGFRPQLRIDALRHFSCGFNPGLLHDRHLALTGPAMLPD